MINGSLLSNLGQKNLLNLFIYSFINQQNTSRGMKSGKFTDVIKYAKERSVWRYQNVPIHRHEMVMLSAGLNVPTTQ